MECCAKRHLLGGGALVGRGTFQTSHNKETQDDRGRRLDGDLSGTNKKSKLAKAYSTMEMVKLLQNMRVVEGVSETWFVIPALILSKKSVHYAHALSNRFWSLLTIRSIFPCHTDQDLFGTRGHHKERFLPFRSRWSQWQFSQSLLGCQESRSSSKCCLSKDVCFFLKINVFSRAKSRATLVSLMRWTTPEDWHGFFQASQWGFESCRTRSCSTVHPVLLWWHFFRWY